MSEEKIHFVTGRLAELSLRAMLAELAPRVGFAYTVDVLPITVAALMTPTWISKHMEPPPTASRIVLPGYCHGDLTPVQAKAHGASVEIGPKDLRQLPEHFGEGKQPIADYGKYNIDIIAEINHAPRLTLKEIIHSAKQMQADGADVIDIGCDPGETWSGVGECAAALRSEGARVSIDSFNTVEIEAAVNAGAELVLSVNAANCKAAQDWGCEVVAIPDEIATLGGLEATIETLDAANVPFRIDPILEPIGCGFAASLQRYMSVRQQYPKSEMMMGVGNLTELTDVDSAGVNVILLAICEELRIRSVLTTQVINWSQTSVKECDMARRLVRCAVANARPPKHIDSSLIMLRDEKLYEQTDEELNALTQQIRDSNYRLFVQNNAIHLLSAGMHFTNADPFVLFEELAKTNPKNLSPEHAFYLGYEMAKAATAITLGKQYTQDESLNWGILTQEETSHRLKK